MSNVITYSNVATKFTKRVEILHSIVGVPKCKGGGNLVPDIVM